MTTHASVEIVMKLFRVMSDEEKRETVLEIGNVCETEGLAAKWSTPSRASATSGAKGGKRRGRSAPYWIKRVDGIDPSAKGMDKLRGTWVREGEFEDGKVYLVGLRGDEKKYFVCLGSASSRLTFPIWGGKDSANVDGLLANASCDTFNDAVREIEHLDRT